MAAPKFLPSKRFRTIAIIVIITAVIVITAGSIVSKKNSTKSADQLRDSKGKVIVLGELVDKDSDSDGLKDWQEALYKTDPYKKDTDGNGISDFDQITAQNNELAAKNASDGNPNTKDTPIDEITKQMYALITSLKQNGNLTPENQAVLSKNLAKYLSERVVQKVYTLKDLHTVADNTDTFVTYNKSLTSVLTKYPINTAVMADFYDVKNDTIDTGKLNTANYETLRQKLLGMTVVDSAATVHLGVINALEQIIEDMHKIAEYENDSLEGMRGLYYYSRDINNLTTALGALNVYIINQTTDIQSHMIEQ